MLSLVLLTATVPLFQNCGGLNPTHKSAMSSDGSGLALQFNRAGLPQAVSQSLSLEGTCDSRAQLTISSEGSASQNAPCVNGRFRITHLLAGADGPRTILVTQVFAGGAQQDSVFVIKDSVAPVLALGQITRQADGLQLVGTCESASSSTVNLGADVLSPTSAACANNVFSAIVTLRPGDGAKQLEVSQRDLAGNLGSSRGPYILDTSAPEVTVTSPSNGVEIINSFEVSGACETGLDVLIGGTGVIAQVAGPCQGGNFRLTANPSAGLGAKLVAISQTDPAQNRGEIIITLIRVAQTMPAPILTILQPAENSSHRLDLVLSGTCEAGLVVTVGGAVASASTASCVNGQFTANVTFSSNDGNKTISVAQTNGQNVTGSASRNFRNDTQPPVVGVTSPVENAAVGAAIIVSGTCEIGLSVSIQGTGVSSPVATVCNGGIFSAPVNLRAGDGMKEIMAAQTDAAGNLGSAIRRVQMSTAPLDGRVLYTNHCAGCHGQIDSSVKRNRTSTQITTAFTSVPAMSSLAGLTVAEVNAIADALRIETPPPGVRQTFACTAGQQARTPMLKLTNREFRLALGALLDDFSATLKLDSQLTTLLNQLPSDSVVTDRNTSKEQPLLLNQDTVARYFEAAFRAGVLVSGNTAGLQNYPVTSGCLAQVTVTQACHRLFVREFGSRAFRRALSSQEGTAIADSIYDPALAKSELVHLTVVAMMQMPDFLYKAFDNGGTSTVGPTVLNLTAHELAAKIAFFITGSPPDAALRAAANSGQILTPATLSQEIDRLLSLPAAQDMVRRLFRETYGYDIYGSFQYSSTFLSGLDTTSLSAAMTQELDDFFVDLVLQGNGTYADLITSRQANVRSASMAQVYGSSTGIVTLPAHRAGFLSRASMLSKRQGNYTSPIRRGLNVLEHVLCEEIGPPPASAPTSIVEPDPGQILSTRERTARTSESAGSVCVACHSRMNPLGYAFENFDSIGRLRATERVFNADGSMVIGNVAVSTQAATSELGATPISFASNLELAAALSNNDKALMCFVKNLKRFEARAVPVAADNCQMNNVLTSLYGTAGAQGSVKAAIKSLLMSNEFRRWNFQ